MNTIKQNETFTVKYDENATGVVNTESGEKQWRGIVVCVMQDTAYDLIPKMIKHDIAQTPLMANRFVGVARCSATDSFDLETGIKIARAKALMKYNRNKFEQLNNVNLNLYKQLDIIHKAKKQTELAYWRSYDIVNGDAE